MTNEEILASWDYGIELDEDFHRILNLARQDEREKWRPHLLDSVLTDAEFKEYTGSEREKMQGVENIDGILMIKFTDVSNEVQS